MGRRFAALYSGGKDSYLALALAREADIEVSPMVTVDAPDGSYLYHVPATQAAAAAATALDITHKSLTVDGPITDAGSEVAARHEIAPVSRWLEGQAVDLDGLISGVVASRYQYELLEDICDTFGLELCTPLWGWDGLEVLDAVLERDLAVDMVAVAADGLDESWLGRRLDADAVESLSELAMAHGFHPAGEGGEFETLVVDAPAFNAPIVYDATSVWEGNRGHLALSSLGLGARPSE